jgi:cytochrome P450
MITDTFIPPGTTIGVTQYAAYRSSRYFTNPDMYAPERFLSDDEHAEDKCSVIQPFL